MKFHLNAKLCLIFLYGCAFVCQTYAAYIVEKIPYASEENNFLADNAKTATTEESAVHMYTTLQADVDVVPEENISDEVTQHTATAEKHEEYMITPPPSAGDETTLNIGIPRDTPSVVTDAPHVDDVTLETFHGSCTKFRICVNGICSIGDCNDYSWEPSIFNPITKRCGRPYYSGMNFFTYHRCRNQHRYSSSGFFD